jgi:hypothetical protein
MATINPQVGAAERACDTILLLLIRLGLGPRAAAAGLAMALGRLCWRCGIDPEDIAPLLRPPPRASKWKH